MTLLDNHTRDCPGDDCDRERCADLPENRFDECEFRHCADSGISISMTPGSHHAILCPSYRRETPEPPPVDYRSTGELLEVTPQGAVVKWADGTRSTLNWATGRPSLLWCAATAETR